MLINAEKWTFNGSISYKIISVNPCCNKILQNPLIDVFYNWFEYLDDESNYCGDMEYSICLCRTDTYPEPYEDYYNTDYHYYKITYCPFCGEEIKINFINEVDKSEEDLSLQKRLIDLRKIINTCDSRKQIYELETEFKKLNYRLNSFYQTDSIKPNNSNKT